MVDVNIIFAHSAHCCKTAYLFVYRKIINKVSILGAKHPLLSHGSHGHAGNSNNVVWGTGGDVVREEKESSVFIRTYIDQTEGTDEEGGVGVFKFLRF